MRKGNNCAFSSSLSFYQGGNEWGTNIFLRVSGYLSQSEGEKSSNQCDGDGDEEVDVHEVRPAAVETDTGLIADLVICMYRYRVKIYNIYLHTEQHV